MISYLSLAIGITIGIGAQLSLKAGALRVSESSSIFSSLLSPYVLIGLFAYFIAALFYINAIKQIPLTMAFPSISISYVVVALLSHSIWGESFGLWHILALLLIGSGLVILARVS